jgi:hypothetical protein
MIRTLRSNISDLEYHRFLAAKTRTRTDTIVTESNLVALPVGSVLTALSGTDVTLLTPLEIRNMFMARNGRMIPTASYDRKKNSKRPLEAENEMVIIMQTIWV